MRPTLLTTLLLLILAFSTPVAAGPVKIVVVPGYAENGGDILAEEEILEHYRRVMRFINNQLVRHNFDVVNPVAHELQEKYYALLAQRTSSSAQSVCAALNRKYGTDAAYIVWLDIYAKRTRDGLCRVSARIEGEGYDSSGHDLGAGLAKDYTTVREDCVAAVELAEKEIGDIVGRKLTAYQP